ncbi:MAG: RluA family pseudouridine synthase, partial [Ureaplasma sp.]|nr:RluA family pseudouridine synthase [Ureaplasma sp.]
NNLIHDPNYLLKNNDIVEIKNNNLKENKSCSQTLVHFLIPNKEMDDLNIVYQDNDLMIVYKPNNVLVYPTYDTDSKTLSHSIYNFYKKNNNKEFDKDLRQGIVHRLDRNTTGLVLVAKKKNIFLILQKMIQNNEIIRKYTCLVHHCFSNDELNKKIKINKEIGMSKSGVYKMIVGNNSKNPKEAITIIQPIKNIGNAFSLVECNMITGRTHQIRVHMRYINHPVLNDPIYGIESKTSDFGQYLMCTNISFNHPITNKLIDIKIDLDKEFIEKINSLKYA